MAWPVSSWSNRLLETLRLSSEIRWNPNDPKLKDNYKPRYKLPLICYHLWKLMCQEPEARSFPREKPEDITLTERILPASGQNFWHVLDTLCTCVSVSSKQELNKLKPPPQPVNLTGRLLLQLGKSLLCGIAHLWQAARNNAPFFWNYSLQSHNWLGVHMQCSLQKDRSVSVSLSKTRCTLSSISLISGSTF